ncbi:MAG: hypothetical protein PHQ34_14435 [Methanothrix sp.]|nr:hypothetical protein [Methanothrix sp.]
MLLQTLALSENGLNNYMIAFSSSFSEVALRQNHTQINRKQPSVQACPALRAQTDPRVSPRAAAPQKTDSRNSENNAKSTQPTNRKQPIYPSLPGAEGAD